MRTFRGKGLTALTWSKLRASGEYPHRLVACAFPVLGWGLRPLPLSHTTNQGVVLWQEGFSDHNIKASDAHSLLLYRTQSRLRLRLRPLPMQNPSSALENAQSSSPSSCCAGAPCWPGPATSSLEELGHWRDLSEKPAVQSAPFRPWQPRKATEGL